jgi:hypothetical protein
MNIFDALKELDKGKAVKRKANDMVFFAVGSPAFSQRSIDSMDKEYFDKDKFHNLCLGDGSFSRQDIETNDWEIYERPER